MFTADLHIKIGQKNVPREWARNRYKIMFDEFDRVKREYSVDLEIHGGDIFDKLPNLEELSTYMGYVSQCAKLVIYDGNHEATKKGETFFDLVGEMLTKANPKCTLVTECFSATEEIPFDILPYCKLKQFAKDKVFTRNSNTLLTHVRGEIPPHVAPEVDLSIFDSWKVVFAGDLHAHSNTQRNIIYPGSPVTVSFHRKPVKTGVIVLDTDTGNWEWVVIKVPQLLRYRVSDKDDIVKSEYDHTIYELEGDAVDLAGVSSDILDKKIIATKSEAALDFTNLSIKEELHLYLKDIVELDSSKLNRCMGYIDDYIKED
jgi:DNA repair exonuclease SbcCD nuclease subunit